MRTRLAVRSANVIVVAAPAIASCLASQVDEATEISTPSTVPVTARSPFRVSPVNVGLWSVARL